MCFIVFEHSVDVAVIVVVVVVVVAQFIAMLLIAKGLGYTREHIAVDEWRYYVRTISILYPYYIRTYRPSKRQDSSSHFNHYTLL